MPEIIFNSTFTVDVFSTFFLPKKTIFNNLFQMMFYSKKTSMLNPTQTTRSRQKSLVEFSGRKHQKSDNFVAFGRILENWQ
ncbi:hypothetical protein [Listeria ivanovii]|uniref:hypothetical protein n=1 Tax=Listeria ivanovii TaxID=1638 RepID=UPI0019451603|nr:hypothetical protein [Listeria ivanovii]